MRSDDESRALIHWLAQLDPRIWWHLGETGLVLQVPPDLSLPPLPKPFRGQIRFLDRAGNRVRETV